MSQPNSKRRRSQMLEPGELCGEWVPLCCRFNLIVLTTNLILAGYGARFANFMIATVSALVVGKAVLVANAMRAIRRYDRAPLIRPILFKTVFYWAIVFVARLLEHWIRFWLVE